MKKVMFVLVLFVFLSSSYPRVPNTSIYSLDSTTSGKKVILLVVDSLLEEPLQDLIKQNKLPLFAFLQYHGWFTNKMVSSFPTMSVTIDSSLLTGNYADQHRIPALRWYDQEEQRYINYGDGAIPIARTGIKQVIQDSLYHMNNTHLGKSVKTIHEELEEKGMDTAAINALIYRSTHPQLLEIPGPYKNIETLGPTYFVLGSFHHDIKVNVKDQYLNYYGVNDQVSLDHLINLIKQQKLPAFTTVYLPDLDHEAHQNGELSSKSVVELDQKLQKVFDAFGTWEEAIKDHVFLVMGDSGVVKIHDDKQEAIVNLEQQLGAFRMAELGRTTATDQLAVAVNERMAYVYLLQPKLSEKEILDRIQEDARLDTISWKNGDWIEVVQGGSLKKMRFRPGPQVRDEYGQSWEVEGDLSVLDLRMDNILDRLDYGNYPDGLMRLYSASYSHNGRFMIVTTQPGYELKAVHSPNHVGGGAHGSLHAQDTYFPFLVIGTEKRPKYMRIVDLKSFILDILK